MKIAHGIFIFTGIVTLLSGCIPRENKAFIQKVLEITKQQTDAQNKELLNRINTAANLSEQEADKLEKRGMLLKKIATKYIELTWLRNTINVNLAGTHNVGPSGTEESLTAQSLTVPGEQEFNNFQHALAYLQQSLAIFYTDENLFFNAGLCCAHIGKYYQQQADTAATQEWFKKARQYYNRAIDLDANYIDALYSLAILLVFELHEPQQGITYLVRIKNHERYNTDARFLLAYTYYITGKYKQALLEYEDLEKLTKKPELQEQARKNQQQILELLRRS